MKNNEVKYFLPIILGPTAAGKTELSIKLAKKFDAEIISADSMQVYKDMDIGTAKVTVDIQNTIPHHMIDILTPDGDFSVADYQKKVDKLIPNIYSRNKLPLLVGGTGLYIKALIEGFLLPEMDNDPDLRKKLRKQAREKGNKYVHNKLAKIDPQLAKKLHPNDLRRVIRGIEIYKQTAKTKTYFIEKQSQNPDRYKALKIGLYREREELYQRINKRVDNMIEQGLVREVKNLLANYELSKTAKQALGYKEIIAYLDGQFDLEEALRRIKRDTRHFAKKQLTWFKRDDSINWFNLSSLTEETVYKDCMKLIDRQKV